MSASKIFHNSNVEEVLNKKHFENYKQSDFFKTFYKEARGDQNFLSIQKFQKLSNFPVQLFALGIGCFRNLQKVIKGRKGRRNKQLRILVPNSY